MATKDYWMLSRPQRKLYRLPLTVSALNEAAAESQWGGNRESHIAFEEILEREGIKRPGPRRDRTGSGGRTHAALVRSLGLAFNSVETGRLELTLAGIALAEGGNPSAVLKHQVMKFQYPSVYSISSGVDISRSFRLRPFVLLLRLLVHPDLGGYLTQDEVARVVILIGTGDTAADTNRVAAEIKQYRSTGVNELEFLERFGKGDDTFEKLVDRLGDIANTVFNWLELTGVIDRKPGQVELVAKGEDEAGKLIEKYGHASLISNPEDEDKFQRRYGLPPGKTKDTRNLSGGTSITRAEFVRRRVTTILTRISEQELLVDGATPEVVARLVDETDFDHSEVAKIATNVLGTDRTLDNFLYTYQSLPHSSAKDAPRKFEQATAEIFRRVFKLDAECVGQAGREPDVVVTKPGEWRGIVDTKAYDGDYSLPSSHERAMKEYVETYQNRDGEVLEFWVFIAASVSRGAHRKAKMLAERIETSGVVIGMFAWLEMIRKAGSGSMDSDQMAALFQSSGELTMADVRSGEVSSSR
ncbi:AlwI restriction endonuclease [Brevibacterium casei]|uniref:AlwI restriction endonuclease n=1 Tax=Brevibacterium casei TaxID=33889 RepID=A0A449D010_9MICO|nr:restriction endonuclease FokI C-terminal domain-containing protein [Brevibacterium casei]VEW10782.1 AlwI restriction endonuclease [Brevibacterium casei]